MKGRWHKTGNSPEQDKAQKQDKNDKVVGKTPVAQVPDRSEEKCVCGKETSPETLPETAVEETPAVSQEKELKDKLLRLRADFENFRKRTLRDREDAARLASENIMLELLPVLDHMELGLNAAIAHKADNAFVEGYKLVSGQLMDALRKFGLKPIEIDGKQFDPKFHEAVSHVHSEKYPDGMILSEVRKGYMLGDKLLRAAQVAVSSGPSGAGEDTTAEMPCAED
jgi:molecular chaperone GrpE